LIVVGKAQGIHWNGGWNPTVTRYILPVIPFLIPFVAAAFDHCRGKGLAWLNSLWLVWSGGITFFLCLVPLWRYTIPDGQSKILQVFGDLLQLDLARFLPSLIKPSPLTWVVLGLWVLVLILLSVYYTHGSIPSTRGWGKGAVRVSLPRLSAGGLALLLIWVAAAAVVPTRSLEAEAMHHFGGIRYDPNVRDPILWVMKEDGEIHKRIVTWPGKTRFTIVAGGYSTTGVSPRLTLLLNDQPVQSWSLKSGEGRWHKESYLAQLPTAFQHPVLKIVCENLLDDPARGRQFAYLDRITIQRARER
jgi:hypothetical protein